MVIFKHVAKGRQGLPRVAKVQGGPQFDLDLPHIESFHSTIPCQLSFVIILPPEYNHLRNVTLASWPINEIDSQRRIIC